MNGGPPVSPIVAATPMDVQWTNAFCSVLNPLFATMTAPPPPATVAEYRAQVAAARAALQQVDVRLHTVGPPPSEDAQKIVVGINDRLAQVDDRLAVAAQQLDTATPSASVSDAARGALTSFDRSGMKPLLNSDLSLSNALVYAPACVQP